MKLVLEKYETQIKSWPESGHHIMAQYDDEKIIVYQSYKKGIGDFATKHQYFGGGFSAERMTWIKPNFLWMMFRNGWGTKEGQESVLAIHLKMSAFTRYLENAVYSSYNSSLGLSNAEWQQQVKDSSVRLQWDPDHNPYGQKLERRAIQIGLRDAFIRSFAKEDIIEIENITDYVAVQFEHVKSKQLNELTLPLEKPLLFKDEQLNIKLRITKP